jgi:hypothetical protein
MAVPQWFWWSLVVLVPLLGYTYFESMRFLVAFEECTELHQVHSAFTNEEVCLGSPLSLQYQQLELANCTRAHQVVRNEPPILCAMRTWWWGSWIEAVRRLFMDVYDKSTSTLMIVCVLPLALVAAYYIKTSEEAKTQREALRSEQQTRPIEAVTAILERMSVNQQEQMLLQQQQQQQKAKQPASIRRIRV